MKKLLLSSVMFFLVFFSPFASGARDEDEEILKENQQKLLESQMEEVWGEEIIFMDSEEEIAAENLKKLQEKDDAEDVLKENKKIFKKREKLEKSEKEIDSYAFVEFLGFTGKSSKSELEKKYPSLENVKINGIKFKKIRLRYDQDGFLQKFTGELVSKGSVAGIKKRLSRKYKFNIKEQTYFAKNMHGISVKYLGGKYFVIIEFNKNNF